MIQIVAEILDRLSRHGVLAREDAWEYLANARNAWKSPEEEAALAARLAEAPAVVVVHDYENAEDGEAGGDEEEGIEEEPLSELVERLDATVFGLVDLARHA